MIVAESNSLESQVKKIVIVQPVAG